MTNRIINHPILDKVDDTAMVSFTFNNTVLRGLKRSHLLLLSWQMISGRCVSTKKPEAPVGSIATSATVLNAESPLTDNKV